MDCVMSYFFKHATVHNRIEKRKNIFVCFRKAAENTDNELHDQKWCNSLKCPRLVRVPVCHPSICVSESG
jgi:hypothetical protein